MAAADRVAIEAKIHAFHQQRGDKTTPPGPAKHGCAESIGFMCGCAHPTPGVLALHAQNFFVMRKFKEVQKEYLQADQP